MADNLVLDIDFDYCAEPTLERGCSDPRLRPAMSLWMEPEELAAWLRARGLLRPETLAANVRRHEEVLPVWLRFLREKRLSSPFTVLHVDAHPDLMDLNAEILELFGSGISDDDLLGYAKSGDFLQYAVRLGWTKRILMLFPDREAGRIDALDSIATAERVVRKSVQRVTKGPLGGTVLIVLVGKIAIEVGLFTRASLPSVPPPFLTVIAQSPEFIPPSSEGAFQRLVDKLSGATHA